MIRGTKINLYIRVMEGLGVSADKLLANTNVDHSRLADTSYTITQPMFHAVIFNMLKLSKNPAIAILVGKEITFGDLGIVGYALMASSTVGRGMSIRQTYSSANAFYGTQIEIESAKPQGKGYELTLSSLSPTERLRQFEIEEYFSSGLTFLTLLTGTKPVVESVSFSYSKPGHFAEYEELFNCPMTFGEEKTRFKVKHPSLDTPVITRNDELYEICTKHCQKIMNSSGESSHLRDRLCSLFLATPGNLPELNAAAKSLGMSERTLRRLLYQERTNYEALKSEFRLDLSRQLLTEATMTPKQVAFFLGYANPSSFSRAFKAWTGQTIQNFLRS